MIPELDITLRLGSAALFGAAIGLNRDLHGKPTGVRTLGVVGLGAALVVLASMDFQTLPGVDADPVSRAIQGILTGIGFLGAGVIVRDSERFKPFSTYLVLLREARRLAPDSFRWRAEAYEFESERLAIDLLLGREELRPMLERGAALDEMESSWAAALDGFLALRSDYLSY